MTIRAIISQAEAKAQGLKRYFTGIPCRRGHVDERRVSNLSCVVCTSYPERSETRKAQARSYNKKRRSKRKIAVAELKTACANCGFDHPAALHFHHKEHKKLKISGIFNKISNISVVKAELAKCIVLCANCHAIEHWDQAQSKGAA